MEFYSALKRNELSSHEKNLEELVWWGKKKKANLKIYDFTYTNLEKAKLFPRTQSFGFQDHLVEPPLLTCYKKKIFSPP